MNGKIKHHEYFVYKLLDLAKNGNIEEIKRIISLDSSILHQQDENGTTILSAASINGHFELVKYLVEAGADVNQLDIYYTPPLLDVAFERHWDIFEYLFELTDRELKESALSICAADGDLEALKALIQKKVNVDSQNILLAVIQQGEFIKIVETLLNAGADPNLTEEDTGSTPLIYAAKMGCSETIRLLLKAGADPNIKNMYDKTALTYAKQKGNSEIVQFLLEAGATEE
ncbi:ankyrin repeat domain-containing protein [Lusitaniella coriacea LEGE 07157]|uniref:Ankyrin repeat domain-containing protein n=1 Tax=Lusitaniella coriacea LEGE 07157 TaxID=945747 RepID=A0A8J7DX98_9CYAN|nr:ankyrin repeat domain-containing protein [Lusitaniella coriacea]MBE9116828.1 ankyrin repeat domain-containing protein [Lusitaniella coriacea LEGE 07157]